MLRQAADALAAATPGRDRAPRRQTLEHPGWHPDGQVKLSDFGIARARPGRVADADRAGDRVPGVPLSPRSPRAQQATPPATCGRWAPPSTRWPGGRPYDVGDNVPRRDTRSCGDPPPAGRRLAGALLEATMTVEPTGRWSRPSTCLLGAVRRSPLRGSLPGPRTGRTQVLPPVPTRPCRRHPSPAPARCTPVPPAPVHQGRRRSNHDCPGRRMAIGRRSRRPARGGRLGAPAPAWPTTPAAPAPDRLSRDRGPAGAAPTSDSPRRARPRPVA